MNWKQALLEAGKIAFRTAWMAAFPVVIDGLRQGQINWYGAGLAALIALLMAADRFIHEWDGTDLKGLSPL